MYDLIFDTFCITTPVLDKRVKSIMEGMFTNKNYWKKKKKMYLRYLQTPTIIDFNHTCVMGRVSIENDMLK